MDSGKKRRFLGLNGSLCVFVACVGDAQMVFIPTLRMLFLLHGVAAFCVAVWLQKKGGVTACVFLSESCMLGESAPSV